jgi:hypothetical protein
MHAKPINPFNNLKSVKAVILDEATKNPKIAIAIRTIES